MVPRDRIELPSAPCKDAALPLDERGLAEGGRVELPRGCEPSTVFKTGSVANLIDLPRYSKFRHYNRIHNHKESIHSCCNPPVCQSFFPVLQLHAIVYDAIAPLVHHAKSSH